MADISGTDTDRPTFTVTIRDGRAGRAGGPGGPAGDGLGEVLDAAFPVTQPPQEGDTLRLRDGEVVQVVGTRLNSDRATASDGSEQAWTVHVGNVG